MTSLVLQTVTGAVPVDQLGLILPHEHLFTDLRGPQTPDYAQADPEEVLRVMSPYLQQAYQVGVTALVECSTGGVGRNITILHRLAENTPLSIVAPTGVYREAFMPDVVKEMTVQVLAEAWIHDLTQGIDGSSIQAGFIKIAVSDEAITPREEISLKAAAVASLTTGAAVASHTIRGPIALQEMDILERTGMDLSRFVWVHASAGSDQALQLQAVKRGPYIELDTIGASPEGDVRIMADVLALIEAGFQDRILLSHDAGWYQPGQLNGQPVSGIRGFTQLVESFLPALRMRGVSEALIRQIVHTNPAQAFGMVR
jgi:phosphotriesterase-related protein